MSNPNPGTHPTPNISISWSQKEQKSGAFFDNSGPRTTMTRTLGYFLWRLFWDVLRLSFSILRYPLALLCVVWISGWALSAFATLMLDKIVRPVCDVPVLSTFCGDLAAHRFDSRQTGSASTGVVPKPDFPALVSLQSVSLSELMAGSADGSQLSLDIKMAQMATSDLISLVKVSDLTTRGSIADALEAFVDEARATARDLQKLNARVSGAVDHILAANEYAFRTIEFETAKSTNAGLLQTIWSWSWPLTDAESGVQRVVATTFQDVMSLFATQTGQVVLQCESTLTNLDRLEQRLHVLHDILSRERSSVTGEQSQVLSELWTMLGGNRRRLWNIDQRLDLLRNVGEYRLRALAHVGRTLQLVQSMGEDMEELRIRVATPTLVEDQIPIEIQLRAIRAAVDRISESRMVARERTAKVADGLPSIDHRI
ncbi:hypothetical protein QCA50_019436 [Cerrena zonata]|uniref:Uncharacterized protein n=1 Tax=Cerrena zonata TaxID=2478898 RepID=A0AAW0F983_9APHY